MIVNPEKFQAIIIDKRKQDQIKVASQVNLLGVEIGNKLNLKQHINRNCKSAANQLNALIRLKRLYGF